MFWLAQASCERGLHSMWKWVVAICVLLLGSASYCADYGQALKDAESVRKASGSAAAAKSLESAIGRDSGEEAEWLRATVLRWKGAAEKDRVAQLTAFVDRFPSSAHVSAALLSVGDLTDKIGGDGKPQWERVVRDHPQTSEAAMALNRLGHLALRNNDPESAIKQFNASAAVKGAIADCRDSSTLEEGFANISQFWKTREIKPLSQAIQAFGVLLSPEHSKTTQLRARLGRGEAFLLMSMPELADQEYKAALELSSAQAYYKDLALFGSGCALHASHHYKAAIVAFDSFLSEQQGETLAAKDAYWKQLRPDYPIVATLSSDKVQELCSVELVGAAAYWKASALYELGQLKEAHALAANTLSQLPGLRIGYMIRALEKSSAVAEVVK